MHNRRRIIRALADMRALYNGRRGIIMGSFAGGADILVCLTAAGSTRRQTGMSAPPY